MKEKQLKYQWMQFLGRYFVERCLIFGSISSVGLFDRGARVMVWLAVIMAGYQWFLAVQHLDDRKCTISSLNNLYDFGGSFVLFGVCWSC